MKITILCTPEDHPVNAYLAGWIALHQGVHEITLIRNRTDLSGGDVLFLISCNEIISKQDRNLYKKVLVIHASDLPEGRGWSPHVWQIIAGKEEIVLSLLEAEDRVDSGDIWKKVTVSIPKHAVFREINQLIFEAELALMDYALACFHTIEPRPQGVAILATSYPRRTPNDSRINPEQSIRSQFDLIRVCDPDRYPAFFELYGHKYIIRVEKSSD